MVVVQNPDIHRRQEADKFIVEDLTNLEILVISEMTIEETDVDEDDLEAEDMIVEVSRAVQSHVECRVHQTARIINFSYFRSTLFLYAFHFHSIKLKMSYTCIEVYKQIL